MIKKTPTRYTVLQAPCLANTPRQLAVRDELMRDGLISADLTLTAAGAAILKKWKAQDLEGELHAQIMLSDLPEPVRQYKAIKGRAYAWDFAWPEFGVVLDVQGGQFIGGGHQTAGGLENDSIKISLASIDGWRVLVVTTNMVKDGRAMLLLRAALQDEGYTEAMAMIPKAKAKRKAAK